MSSNSTGIRDIVLGPGDLFFGDHNTRIRTLLGSCVALTVWHPRLLIGGMCHYMLPHRFREEIEDWPGRYADEAVALLLGEIERANSRPEDYQMKIFGGARTFDLSSDSSTDIGPRNIEAALELARRHGFPVTAMQVGGRGPLSLWFEIWSGDVWCNGPSQRNREPQ